MWLLILAVIFLPLERLFAVRRRKIFRNSLASDIGFYFISGLVPACCWPRHSRWSLLAPTHSCRGAFRRRSRAGRSGRARWAPWWSAISASTGAIAGRMKSPFCGASIRSTIARALYFLISARAHPIDHVFIRLCGLIPVYILGLATPLTPRAAWWPRCSCWSLTMWGFFIHANVRWRLGPLEWLISTPAFHHWHHTLAEPRDRNYRVHAAVMDWIFGTHYLPRKQWPSAYGIEAKLPGSLAGQLVYPLRLESPQAGSSEAVTVDR